ncbi:zinc finger MYM-type protein 1-like [Olea europaea var. sylvestris]|uniref:zinc finger MYM-type protein 1-like n=1 Tax=Olea europaea var. sylvestris TaxID=158386 RepID=UPI000C1CF36C|nr:zinc finger MYM-type protein 1-like [Olea europaea var. sylvestris]
MDMILFFCCKLFKTPKNVIRVGQLGNDRFKDWHNLHRSIKSHEGNEEHICCMTSWFELENRLRTKTRIDKGVELLIDAERDHWRHVLTRIISIVKRLVKNTFPFRGDDEKLNVENNGLFLQMVEMVSEFDPIMKEHLRRANAKEIQYTYLGQKKIQNELIQLLANEVRSAIVKKVKHAKYFAIILDCTPDASQEEQMSLIVRFVDDSANLPTVEEYWLEFFKVDDTTGLGLTTELQKALIKLDLDIDDIRGQWLLHAVNIVSKFLQTKSMDIDHAIDLLQGLVSFLEDNREIGFAIAMDESIKKANEMRIEAVFTEKRIIRRKKQFDENCSNEAKQTVEESFRVEKKSQKIGHRKLMLDDDELSLFFYFPEPRH